VCSAVDTPSRIPFPQFSLAPPLPDNTAAGLHRVQLVPSASNHPSATGTVTIPVPQTATHYRGERASSTASSTLQPDSATIQFTPGMHTQPVLAFIAATDEAGRDAAAEDGNVAQDYAAKGDDERRRR
jgi:hypothetical protein